jgi:hypothetical protein
MLRDAQFACRGDESAGSSRSVDVGDARWSRCQGIQVLHHCETIRAERYDKTSTRKRSCCRALRVQLRILDCAAETAVKALLTPHLVHQLGSVHASHPFQAL